ncbi:Translation initiation factor IF-2 [Babesia microti strain RI]|uniref:Translation initiation factor IF-2 n=1 Tax=Babesia microti (strain RI) TaxID=1133968 RepID=A0A1N6LY58_BABMR|nr:Translation initiation factor IF-2 [Babesia microti strain RI]SIO73805.1 Translation initiation factor IF-2 [Babesia microti strain RI]|eukprot:XP_021337864.1 Translation initiation factor IF-2 [Babesia microti strain RI]
MPNSLPLSNNTRPNHRQQSYIDTLCRFISYLSIFVSFARQTHTLAQSPPLPAFTLRIPGFISPFQVPLVHNEPLLANKNLPTTQLTSTSRLTWTPSLNTRNTGDHNRWRSLHSAQLPPVDSKYRVLRHPEAAKDQAPTNSHTGGNHQDNRRGNAEKWLSLAQNIIPARVNTTYNKGAYVTGPIHAGLVYDAVITKFLNYKHALVSIVSNDAKCILINDVLWNENTHYTYPNLFSQRASAILGAWAHLGRRRVLPIRTISPLSYDVKQRPYVTIALDRTPDYYPPLTRGMIVNGIPVCRHGDSIVFRSLHGNYHLDMFLSRCTLDNKFSMDAGIEELFLPGEVVELEVLSPPRLPYISSFLARLPLNSPVRNRWAEIFPMHREAFLGPKMSLRRRVPRNRPFAATHSPPRFPFDVSDSGKYMVKGVSDSGKYMVKGVSDSGKYVAKGVNDADRYMVKGVSDSGKYVAKGVNDADRYMVKGVSDSGKYMSKGVNDADKALKTRPPVVMPTESVTLRDFLKSVNGRMDMVSKYVFMKTRRRIGADCLISPNMAKSFYNVISQSQKFTDIDGALEATELRALTNTGPKKYHTVVLIGSAISGKTELFRSLCAHAQSATRGAADGTPTGHEFGLASVETGGRRYLLFDAPGHPAFAKMTEGLLGASDIAVAVVSAKEGLQEAMQRQIQRCVNLKLPLVVCVTDCSDCDRGLEDITLGLSVAGVTLQPLGPTQLIQMQSQPSPQSIYEALSTMPLPEAEALAGGGVVIDSGVARGVGRYALAVLQEELERRDFIIYSGQSIVAKRLFGLDLKPIAASNPGDAVYIAGLDCLIPPGTAFVRASNEQDAREICALMPQGCQAMPSEEFSPQGRRGLVPAVVKSHSLGTAEAISTSLRGLLVEDTPSDVRYGPVTAAPGVMTSGDIHRASPNGIIFLYGMGCPKDLLAAASRRGVSIISCSSMDEILSLGMGELERRRSAKPLGGVLTGTAIVGKVFGAVKDKKAAGFTVQSGKILGGSPARVIRNGEVIFVGQIASLRHTRSEVSTVSDTGGLTLAGFDDFMVGDTLECYSR